MYSQEGGTDIKWNSLYDHTSLFLCADDPRDTQIMTKIYIYIQNTNICSSQKYEEFSVEHITENVTNNMKTAIVVASSRREAAKLYGLYLKHSGILKHLGGNPCCVRVKISASANDHLGQCFKLWDTCNKIYAECFVSHKRVSYILYFRLLYVYVNICYVSLT